MEGVEPSSGLLLWGEIWKGCGLFEQNVYQLVLGERAAETTPMAFRAPSPGQCPCCSTGIAPGSTKFLGTSYATQGCFWRQPSPMTTWKNRTGWVGSQENHHQINKCGIVLNRAPPQKWKRFLNM